MFRFLAHDDTHSVEALFWRCVAAGAKTFKMGICETQTLSQVSMFKVLYRIWAYLLLLENKVDIWQTCVTSSMDTSSIDTPHGLPLACAFSLVL